MSIRAAFIMPHPPVILPEIGRGQEKEIQKTIDACNEIGKRIEEIKPDTIVLTSPHAIRYSDYFHISKGKTAAGNFGQFGAGAIGMSVEYDEEFVRELENEAWKAGVNAGTQGEKETYLDHGTMVPLSFINKKYKDYKLVRIGLSGLSREDHYELGKTIAKVSENLGKKVVFIASGDLSHRLKADGPYGLSKEGPIFDKEIMEAIGNGDFVKFMEFEEKFCENAAECGLGSFIIMAGALDGKKTEQEVLSYEGPFGVGYGVAAFSIINDINKDIIEKDEYVKIAVNSIETYIKTGKMAILDDDVPKEMLSKRAGVFVSLKKHGNLRGCIGTIGPTTSSVAEEILQNAISAAVYDPRFEPVRASELPEIEYSVDVLSLAEPIESKDMLDEKRYGVIVTCGTKRGLLLPNLEGVDTVDEQISIALRKAGINPSENYSLERFEVVRHR